MMSRERFEVTDWYLCQSGWPASSFAGLTQLPESFDIPENVGSLEFSMPSESRMRYLPYRPSWPGFALNTLFYATVLWLLIPGPFALRRFVRVRRGLCPACAYPMGESAGCSECGKPLPARARVTT